MKNAILLAVSMIFSDLSCANEDSFILINNGKETRVTTSDLEKMPSDEIRTSTNFTPLSVFTGVRFSDLVKITTSAQVKYELSHGMITATRCLLPNF